MRKLQIPSLQPYYGLKYSNAIEPIELVNASKLPNNSCGYMALREHVGVLHMASNKAFHCLKSNKISTSTNDAKVAQVKYKSPKSSWLFDFRFVFDIWPLCIRFVYQEMNDFKSLQPQLNSNIFTVLRAWVKSYRLYLRKDERQMNPWK